MSGTPAASAQPVQAFDFDTFVNIDCYFFSTGDEGIAFNGLGINYGSSSSTVHAYFKIDGPFALQASQILYDREANVSGGSWSIPTNLRITGNNAGYWTIEMKVYSQFGLLATVYDDTSC